jgi:ABC-type phosphate/phosphonate transport system substrate-binding protein
MVSFTRQDHRRWWIALAVALAILPGLPAGSALAQKAKIDKLLIGTTGSLSSEDADEKGAMDTLKDLIRTETGLDNEIIGQKEWRELADKMAKKELHLGVFQGYEFGWAQGQHARLKPLAVAVLVYRYPVVYIVARKDNKATDFAGLKGQSLALRSGVGVLQLFVERKCKETGKDQKSFFSKVTTPANLEDALDDVVDGAVQATVVHRPALESFKRRKPARFNQLKEVIHSQPFPPVLVAYYENVLDDETLRRFRDGLLNASKKEKGRELLTLFRLTGFEGVPDDFDRVLAETRKAYPPPEQAGK